MHGNMRGKLAPPMKCGSLMWMSPWNESSAETWSFHVVSVVPKHVAIYLALQNLVVYPCITSICCKWFPPLRSTIFQPAMFNSKRLVLPHRSCDVSGAKSLKPRARRCDSILPESHLGQRLSLTKVAQKEEHTKYAGMCLGNLEVMLSCRCS